MKNLANIKGMKTLSQKEQKKVNGGEPQEYGCTYGSGLPICPVRCIMGYCLL